MIMDQQNIIIIIMIIIIIVMMMMMIKMDQYNIISKTDQQKLLTADQRNILMKMDQENVMLINLLHIAPFNTNGIQTALHTHIVSTTASYAHVDGRHEHFDSLHIHAPVRTTEVNSGDSD